MECFSLWAPSLFFSVVTSLDFDFECCLWAPPLFSFVTIWENEAAGWDGMFLMGVVTIANAAEWAGVLLLGAIFVFFCNNLRI
jgi:hypothetical protein